MPQLKDIEVDGDVKRGSIIEDGRMYDVVEQDIAPYLKDAAERRIIAPEGLSQNKYKADSFGCTYAATIPSGVVESMAKGQCCTEGKKWDLLANDPDEYRAALVHVQSCHKELMVVNGNPFAKSRTTWQ